MQGKAFIVLPKGCSDSKRTWVAASSVLSPCDIVGGLAMVHDVDGLNIALGSVGDESDYALVLFGGVLLYPGCGSVIQTHLSMETFPPTGLLVPTSPDLSSYQHVSAPPGEFDVAEFSAACRSVFSGLSYAPAFVDGACMCISRGLLTMIGGFDNSLGEWVGLDYTLRAYMSGFGTKVAVDWIVSVTDEYTPGVDKDGEWGVFSQKWDLPKDSRGQGIVVPHMEFSKDKHYVPVGG